MPIVVGVKFRGSGKVYYFAPNEAGDLAVNDHVIVETARGVEMGQVAMAPQEVADDKVVGQLKPVMRKASPADLLDAQRYRAREAEALAQCKEQVARAGLPMKVVQAEFNYDGTRLTFSFSSEQRVDFRDLVRELARVFKTRIELRQIGVRDEARITGGIGKCGRPLCCATWLNEFAPVSIRMAKQQDLPLSPMEISGLCGRLLCCLAYETDYYKEIKSQFPKVGKVIETSVGPAKVIKIRVFKETADVVLEDGSTLELTADQVAGKAPITAEPRPAALNGMQQRALGRAVGGSSRDAEADEEGDDSAAQDAAPRPMRRPLVEDSADDDEAVDDAEEPEARPERDRGRPAPAQGRPQPQQGNRGGQQGGYRDGGQRQGQPPRQPQQQRGPQRPQQQRSERPMNQAGQPRQGGAPGRGGPGEDEEQNPREQGNDRPWQRRRRRSHRGGGGGSGAARPAGEAQSNQGGPSGQSGQSGEGGAE